MPRRRYGRNYWLGVARIVGVFFVIGVILHLALKLFGIEDTDGASGLIVGFFFWPVLIGYHLSWRQRTKRAPPSK